jgi:ferric-dicitrate binding protein FerR (iron transport regulator)
MNTTPDETTLALWLDDELAGDEVAAVEAWAAAHPEHLDAREETRRYKAAMQAALPASIEPPSQEFFNARIARLIETSAASAAPAAASMPANRVEVPFRLNPRSWFMPAAAAAGMAAAFWVGSNSGSRNPAVADALPDVYVPESGVAAQWVPPGEGQGGVIVLTGVSAIPDSTDFSQTVYLPLPREIDHTAGQGTNGDFIR